MYSEQDIIQVRTYKNDTYFWCARMQHAFKSGSTQKRNKWTRKEEGETCQLFRFSNTVRNFSEPEIIEALQQEFLFLAKYLVQDLMPRGSS